MTDLRNKVVFITGASAGIGKACARAFASAGADLILAARRLDRIKKLAEQLESTFNVNCRANVLDVRNNDAVNLFVTNLPDKFRDIDILVNNAGLARGLDPIQSGKIEDWNEMIDTNVKGLLHVTRAVLPGMVERKSGHIINIGSIAGRQVYPNGGVYCASKFAVRALNQAMQIDLLNSPVRVSTVDPGLVKTEFAWVRFRDDDEKAESVYAGMKPLTSEDVAEGVIFCATRPPHANVAELLLMPTDQASAVHVRRDNE